MLTFNNIKIKEKYIEMPNYFSLSIPHGCTINLRYSNELFADLFYNLILGFYEPEEGYVAFNNVPILSDLSTYHRHIISGITKKDNLNDDLPIIDSLEFWAKIRNTEEMILPAATYFEVTDYLDYKYKNLSPELKIKVKLIRLLLFNTKIWVIDIDFQNIEQKLIDMLSKLIISKTKDGGIVITFNNKYSDFINLDNYFKEPCLAK